MGLNSNGVGIIAAVCSCGFKLYWYAIGEKSNKTKFIGPPTPQKILYQFDVEKQNRCPMCGRELKRRPVGIYFMSRREFEERYVVGRYRIYSRKSLVEEHMRESVTAGVGVDTAVLDRQEVVNTH
ncbi:MAG: hypothetical protein GSR84_06780 [Desulfurococcales archaeon]|nr:hypothetical protein [Desulfurococcales archaeon]